MRMGRLRENYLHNLSVDGASGWLAKHRRYAQQEAEAFLAHSSTVGQQLRELLGGPGLARRRALKHLSYHLLGRPALRFTYQYLLRGGSSTEARATATANSWPSMNVLQIRSFVVCAPTDQRNP